jgi:integrase
MKRSRGEGTIDTRGENAHRLRYRIGGKRFTKTFHGTLSDARKELRALIRSGDIGQHVAPDKVTVAEWIEQWLALLERQAATGSANERDDEPHRKRGRSRGLVNRRTLERYAELLRYHVVPTLGARALQQVQPSEIDDLYISLEEQLAPRTVHHVHTVFGACLDAAVRKAKLINNPIRRAEAPAPGDDNDDVGTVLEAEQLRELVEGFHSHPLFAFVAAASFTGARRGEILALRWRDLDVAAKTVRIERSVEETKKFGVRFKEPKRARHKRTITIDDELLALLVAERERYLRLVAGVPEGATVDLALVRLPDDALIFPKPTAHSANLDLTAPRRPRNVSKEFVRKACSLGFEGLRLHDLRGTHETLLLDAGVPVHVVAARCGHDPAVLLRIYAKRTRKADTSAAAVIGTLAKSVLRS